MSKYSRPHSPYAKEAKRKKRKILVKRVSIYTLLFLIIFIGLSFLSKWEKTNIKSVTIVGNKVTDSYLVEKLVKEQIAGYYLWFFPKANFLIYPKGKIKDKLTSEFKIFKEVSISLKGIKTLEIKVLEREGKYTWCGNSFTDSPEKCYFMDENGYIFDVAPYFSGDVYLKFFGKGELGVNFSPDIFSKLISFRDNIEKLEIKTSSLSVKDDGDIELYLANSSQNTPKIIFKTNSDFEKILGNLQAILATEPLQSDFKKKYSSLEYIDLRFGNKVYYRFK